MSCPLPLLVARVHALHAFMPFPCRTLTSSCPSLGTEGPNQGTKHRTRHGALNLLGGCWRRTEHGGGPSQASLQAWVAIW